MKKIAQILIFFTFCFCSLHGVDGESPMTKERTEQALQQYRAAEDMDGDEHFYNELWNVAFALVVIVVLMIVGSWFLKKFMQGRMEQINVSSTIKILDQRNISTKSVLYIVEVYNKHILIGESASGIAGIAEFPIEDDKTFQELMEKK